MSTPLARMLALGFLVAAPLVAMQTSTTPIRKGPNVLAGRVLDIGTDAPVGGAVVTLKGYFDASGKPTEIFPHGRLPETLAPRSVMTTATGDYVFRELPAGPYSVWATALGYESNEYPPHIVELGDAGKSVNFPLRLWKSNAISGRVVDEQGDPVVGMPVFALRSEVVGGAVVLRQSWIDAITDDRGEYRIAPLPPGRYVAGVLSSAISLPAYLASAIDASASDRDARNALRFELGWTSAWTGEGFRVGEFVIQRSGPPPAYSPDGRVLSYANTLFPGTASPADATILTLESGDSRTGVDIAVRYRPSVRVAGVVTGPDGPLKHLKVQLLPPIAADVADLQEAGVATAMTDSAGRFTFLGVIPGPYVLKASTSQEATQTSPEVSRWASEALTVGETDITGVAVTLRPGARVSGRVVFKGGAVTTAAPSLRLYVQLRPVEAEMWAGRGGEVRPDGTFTMLSGPPGWYIVGIGNQPPSWTGHSVTSGGTLLADDIFDLGSENVTDLTVTLTNTPTRLKGSIVDGKGAPDPDTDVIVFPAGPSRWRDGILKYPRVRVLHASAAAAFEFTALPPGDYHVVAIGRRFAANWRDAVFLEQVIPGAVRVTLNDGDEKTVALKTFTPRGR